MKRFFCAVLAMLLCLGVFAGCAKKPTPLPPLEEISMEGVHSHVEAIPTKKLTQENFDKLYRGMSLEEAEYFLGKGQWIRAYYFNAMDRLDVCYAWAGLDGQKLGIWFTDDVAVDVVYIINLKQGKTWYR